MIAAPPDLLIVGGLAIDRLPNGSTVGGGTVLHGARAAAASGRRIATITVMGPEPEAVAAAAELGAMGPSLFFPAPTSIRYAIQEGGGHRRLVLEAAGVDLVLSSADVAAMSPPTVLLAPIAAELGPAALGACASVPTRVAALQGWLRRLVPGAAVRPVGLDALGNDLSAELGGFDALIASDEDLLAVAEAPPQQMAVLRAHFGPRPLLVITAGPMGAWLDGPGAELKHLRAPTRIAGGSTIGAGDAFASFLALGLGSRLDPSTAVKAAILGSAGYLAARR